MTHKMFRLRIKPKGFLQGNINSNTFFGVFCQAYKMTTDEEELRIFLECLADNSEELTFSNPLVSNTNNLIKRFRAVQNSHCMISRNSDGNNELRSTIGIATKQFDILVYTTLSQKDITKLCRIVELLGIGAQRSTGNGAIEIVNIIPEELPVHSSKMTILSDLVPDKETPTYGNFEFTTRKGITINGTEQAMLIQIKAGSIFANNKVDKTVYGKVIYDEQSDTFINCKAIAV